MLSRSQTLSAVCETCFSKLTPGEQCSRCREEKNAGGAQSDVLPPGCVLGGKFKIGRLLGRGGFGATYLAWDLNLEVRIAIKEFLPRQLVSRVPGGTKVRPYPGSENAFNIGLQQFLAEARNLAQFRDYPSIIAVLDFFPENGTGYMVMEYLDGNTLEQYISAAGQLDVSLAARLLIPVADALRACHAVGLIHRDISPDNIFLTSDHRVKLLDFGAARFAIGQQSTNLSVILKEGYAPFEQYQRNGRQGAWTDIYALTATLYRLLTGELPTTAPDRVAGTPLPSLADKGVKASRRLQALVDKGMAIQPEQRYQTVEEFLADLQAVVPRDTPDPVPDGHSRKLHVAALVFAVAVLGSVAGLAVFLKDHTPSPPVGVPPAPVRPENSAIATPPPQPAPVRPESSALTTLPVPQQPAPARPENSPSASPPAPQPMPQPAIVKPAAPSSVRPLTSEREYVRQGYRYQAQLRLAVLQARRASTTLGNLRAISNRTEIIENAIQNQERLYRSATDDKEAFLEKYIAQVEWLGEHDVSSVDMAIEMEREAAAIISIDKNEAVSRSATTQAIDLMARHIRLQRQKQLSPAQIISDVTE